MSVAKIYVDGRLLGTGVVRGLDLPKPVPVTFKTVLNKSWQFNGVFTLNKKKFKRLLAQMYFTRKEIKKMYYKVTHGYSVVFFYTPQEDGITPSRQHKIPFYIDTPRNLRIFLSRRKRLRCEYNFILKNYGVR